MNKVHFSNVSILPVTGVSVAVDGRTQRVTHQVLLEVELGGIEVEVTCLIIPHLNKDVIIG